MVERRELITIFRQISSMMEAGVDIRRIIRVLSAQTENPRLLSLYDELDHDLRMGKSLADAMERASDVFSPFAISLVRTSEDPYNTKNTQDLAGTFYRIADFLQKEEEVAVGPYGSGNHAAVPAPGRPNFAIPLSTPVLTVNALDGLIDRIQVAALSSLTLAAGLLLSLAAVWWSVEVQLIERRWLAVTLCSVAALFIGAAGVLVRRHLERDGKRELRCSFCGQTSEESGEPLKQATRFASTAICAGCASAFVQQSQESEAAEEAAETQKAAAAKPAAARPKGAGSNLHEHAVITKVTINNDPAAPQSGLPALPTQGTKAPGTGARTANGNTGKGPTEGRTAGGGRASQVQADGEATYE